MDWLGRIFDITNLPSKFFAWAIVLSGGYLFMPPGLQAALHLDGLAREYKTYAGIALAAASSFLAINFALWVWEKFCSWYERRSTQLQVVEAIANLDQSEQAVLREFFIQGRHVIELPLDHPTVAGLLQKRILKLSSRQGYRSPAGTVFPVSLTDPASTLLAPAYVDLPTNPTDGELVEILECRPNFLPEIERRDQWRGGF